MDGVTFLRRNYFKIIRANVYINLIYYFFGGLLSFFSFLLYLDVQALGYDAVFITEYQLCTSGFIL